MRKYFIKNKPNCITMWNLSKPSQIDWITILKKLFDYEISIFSKDSKNSKIPENI